MDVAATLPAGVAVTTTTTGVWVGAGVGGSAVGSNNVQPKSVHTSAAIPNTSRLLFSFRMFCYRSLVSSALLVWRYV